MVEAADVSGDAEWAEGIEVGFAWQWAPQSADGVFDAALLPWAMGVAEEGLHAETVVKAVMLGELGSIIEADGFTQSGMNVSKPSGNSVGGEDGFSIGGAIDDGEARGALVKDKQALAIF